MTLFKGKCACCCNQEKVYMAMIQDCLDQYSTNVIHRDDSRENFERLLTIGYEVIVFDATTELSPVFKVFEGTSKCTKDAEELKKMKSDYEAQCNKTGCPVYSSIPEEFKSNCENVIEKALYNVQYEFKSECNY